MPDLNEKQWIEKAKNDPLVFGELFEKYYSPILNYILRRVGDVQVAQDITSDVFFIVLKKLWQFRWRNIPFSAWLYRIAGNEVSHYFRKNKVRSVSLEALMNENSWEPADALDLETELKEAEALLEQHQDYLQLQKLLFALPLKYQEVLCLKYLENKKIREISLILGKKENTVKSLLKRGLDLLQKKALSQKMLQPNPSFSPF